MKFVITGDCPSKKNSRKMFYIRGRPVFAPGKVHSDWHAQAAPQLYGIKPIAEVSQITLTFYPQSKRKSDLTNKAESIMDLLVDCGVLTDDNWFVVPSLTLKFGGADKLNPRVEIIINGPSGHNKRNKYANSIRLRTKGRS